MIAAPGLRWLLTVVFVALAVYGGWRARVPGHAAVARVAHGLHAVMAVAMAAMVWPWAMGVGIVPQVAFFSLAAVWFVTAAVARPGLDTRARALAGAVPHTLMMAGMAGMIAAMDAATAGGSGSGMGAMPGMDMSGGPAVATMTLQDGSRPAGAVLAVIFLALALWWLARGFDRARRAVPDVPRTEAAAEHSAWDLGCHGAMSLGMAVMFALMV